MPKMFVATMDYSRYALATPEDATALLAIIGRMKRVMWDQDHNGGSLVVNLGEKEEMLTALEWVDVEPAKPIEQPPAPRPTAPAALHPPSIRSFTPAAPATWPAPAPPEPADPDALDREVPF